MSDGKLGTFYGVGVGPGDPELITLKAARVLAAVDWIFYPAETRGGTSFCQRIIAPLDLPAAKCQAVYMGMSRDRSNDLRTYESAVDDIVAELRQGKSVAWITQGDPLFYSTFIHLYEQMRQRFPDTPIEIIPGVTSPSAAAARAGVPVSRLEEKIAVIPAVYGLERLPTLLDEFATVFLMKVNSVFDQLLDTLRLLPPAVHAVYLEKVGTAEERLVTDLEALRGQKLPYFSLVLLRHEQRAARASETREAE
jgi:precorrin-2/cobalt-factor-2 C20-methyltransferase